MATSIVSFAGYSRVVTQRSLSSPNNGCEEDYDSKGLTQLTQSHFLLKKKTKDGLWLAGCNSAHSTTSKNVVSVFEHNTT